MKFVVKVKTNINLAISSVERCEIEDF